MKKIYFIGRYTGHGIYRFFPFYKENYRPYEIEGISKSKNIQITNNIKNADIIMCLLSDSGQKDTFPIIENYLTPNQTLYFTHGFRVVFNKYTNI